MIQEFFHDIVLGEIIPSHIIGNPNYRVCIVISVISYPLSVIRYLYRV